MLLIRWLLIRLLLLFWWLLWLPSPFSLFLFATPLFFFFAFFATLFLSLIIAAIDMMLMLIVIYYWLFSHYFIIDYFHFRYFIDSTIFRLMTLFLRLFTPSSFRHFLLRHMFLLFISDASSSSPSSPFSSLFTFSLFSLSLRHYYAFYAIITLMPFSLRFFIYALLFRFITPFFAIYAFDILFIDIDADIDADDWLFVLLITDISLIVINIFFFHYDIDWYCHYISDFHTRLRFSLDIDIISLDILIIFIDFRHYRHLLNTRHCIIIRHFLHWLLLRFRHYIDIGFDFTLYHWYFFFILLLSSFFLLFIFFFISFIAINIGWILTLFFTQIEYFYYILFITRLIATYLFSVDIRASSASFIEYFRHR